MKKIPLLVTSIGALLLPLSTAQAQEVTLKAASFLPRQVVFAKYFYQWADEVNKQCAGKVKITIVGPAAVPSLKQWQALKSGVVDMHYGPANYYAGAMPSGDVTVLADNEAKEWRKNGALALLQEKHSKLLNAHFLTSML